MVELAVNVTQFSSYWWKKDKEEVYNDIFGIISFLDKNQSYQRLNNILNFRLYGNANILGMDGRNFSYTMTSGPEYRITLNVIQSICDTVTSKIAKNKPKPTFLTSGGNWSLKRKAKLLDKTVEGIFYEAGFHDLAQTVFRDATVFGTGVLKIYRCGSKIKMERVLADEIYIDEADGIYGNPRQIHQIKYISKDQLTEMFPKDKGFIGEVKSMERSSVNSLSYPMSTYANIGNLIRVVESWHLPSSADATDGKHAISIENRSLLFEPYSLQYFPFVFYRWSPRLVGFWGQGIPEQLKGIQMEINKLLRTIQTAMHLCSIPKVFVENGSKVDYAHLNNEIGGIVTFTGSPPQYQAISAVSPELFNQLNWLYQRAYEIIGISQLSAQAKKPSGLDSRPALREYNDIETERFMIHGQRYEQISLDAAKQVIDLAKEIYEEEGFSVKTENGRIMQEINWKDINLSEDDYILKIFPTSSLPSTPYARLDFVQELIQGGFIYDRSQALSLLNFPDLESFVDLETSYVQDIEKIIEDMIENGNYHAPEVYENLQFGIKKMISAYLRAKLDKVPEDRLELLRKWISDAKEQLDKLSQPTPEEMAAQASQGTPQGVPQAPPQSDLIQNVPGLPGQQPPTIQ